MKNRPFAALALLALLAACGGPELRYAVPQITPTEKVSIAFASVEVREITLPTYAALEEIFVETPEGVITTADKLLWADDPARAATLELSRARHVDGRTGGARTVALRRFRRGAGRGPRRGVPGRRAGPLPGGGAIFRGDARRARP
jgi:hypothetical protein